MKTCTPLACLMMLTLASCKPEKEAARRPETLAPVRDAAALVASLKNSSKSRKPLEVAKYSAAMQKLTEVKSAAAADGWTSSEITTAEHGSNE